MALIKVFLFVLAELSFDRTGGQAFHERAGAQDKDDQHRHGRHCESRHPSGIIGPVHHAEVGDK
ncbi:hypothetical protein [Paenibacillus sp. sptzw28]|uniref:hypothetical protein n=1 Tax=Paenibacillus sp. sptzw28 TaxID=715179 RepID=UPI0021628920|nr:hypothetical protein [Paenibacillus sp. sptzw28]